MSNDDKPPFDVVRATFFLIAGVVAVYAIVVLMGMVGCLWNARAIFSSPNVYCDPQGRLTELMASALAAALAFIGGSKWSGPPPSRDRNGPPVLPPRKAAPKPGEQGDDDDPGPDAA
jgi:hypothetical protein